MRHVVLKKAVVVAVCLIAGLVIGSDLFGQAPKKLDKWEYTVLRHSPHLREGGSDLKRLQSLGRDGWEVASSYPVKGEIIVSILKRRR